MTNATVTVLWAWPGTWLRSTSAEASTPLWLADAIMVERALEVKRACAPGPYFWRRLADLLRCVDGVLKGDLEQLDYAMRLLGELAASLPDPCLPDYDPRTIGVVAARRFRQHPATDISACVALLAAELSDPQPSYLRGVASVLDELAMALLLYPQPAPDPSTPHFVAPEANPPSPFSRAARQPAPSGPASRDALEPVATASQSSNTRHQYGAPKS